MPVAYLYVRMSTAPQSKGDSLRRQVANGLAYARDKGLRVSEETFQDIGVSGFGKSNVDNGELGRFITAVESGRVPTGSYLLIESLDRLTRQAVWNALELFLRILRHDIVIVTLFDLQEYRQPVNTEQLMTSIGIMSRAHDESLHKQKRLREAWASKRSKIGTEKLTARCPSWLILSTDRRSFSLDLHRVEIVKRIFEEAANGLGCYVITRRLNEEKVAPFQPAKPGRVHAWGSSSVKKILHSRAVIGEFQPRTKEGPRKSVGPAIADYFPRIIDDNLFYGALGGLAERRAGGGGRKGLKLSNLFTKVATCGYCHSRMGFVNKSAKNGSFLVCDGAKRGLPCYTTKGWRYDRFESSFFSFVRQFDLGRFFDGEQNESNLQKLIDHERRCKGEAISIAEEHTRIFALLRRTAAPSQHFEAQFLALDSELNRKRTEHERAVAAVAALREKLESERQAHTRLPEYINQVQSGESPNVYRVRSAIAASLRTSIKSLKLYNDGNDYRSGASVAELMKNLRLSRSEAEYVAKRQKAIQPFHLPWFEVDMGGTNKVRVVPDPADCHSFLFKQDGPQILTHGADGEPLSAIVDLTKRQILI